MAKLCKGTISHLGGQLVILALLFNFIVKSDSSYYCPRNWILASKICLKLYHSRDTWENARKTCSQQGGDLVIIPDNVTHDKVLEVMRAQINNFWIGLNDRAREGTFVWLDEKTPTEFQFWRSGEPNNFRTENCVYMEAGRNFKWNDIPCDSLSAYSCGRPAGMRSG